MEFEFIHNLNFCVLSPIEFLSFDAISVLKFFHNWGCWALSQFEFCPNLSFGVLWQLELLTFLRTWIWSQINFWDVKFSVYEVCHNLSFWAVTIRIFYFVKIWVFELLHLDFLVFSYYLSFSILSQLSCWALCQFDFSSLSFLFLLFIILLFIISGGEYNLGFFLWKK